LKERYREDISLEDVCKKAMISKTYFYILFKHFVGKTFNEYITELRVQKNDGAAAAIEFVCHGRLLFCRI